MYAWFFGLTVLLSFISNPTAQLVRAPDGHLPDDQLVYAQGGKLYVVKFWKDYELEIVLLFESDDLWARDPEWSTDGKSIAFIGEADGQSDVYLWSSGPPVRLTNTPDFELELRWSPDDQKLSFTQHLGEISEPDLIVYDFDTRASSVLAKGVAGCCHEWVSPGEIVLIPLDVKEERVVRLDEPHVYLPYEGQNIRHHQISLADLGLIYPMASAGVVELERSPGRDYRYAVYDLFDAERGRYSKIMVVYDQDRAELMAIEDVHPGNIDWRPTTDWPE